MSTAPSGRRLARGLVLAGATVVALMVLGYMISMRTETHPPSVAVVPDSQPSAVTADTAMTPETVPADTAPVSVVPTSPAPQATLAPRAVSAPIAVRDTVAAAATTRQPAPPPSVAVADTGRWEYAIATTWVRVRGAPARDAEILRMVDSAQRVRLGPPLNGWRPIRVGVDRGWVDPRLFTVIPTPAPRP